MTVSRLRLKVPKSETREIVERQLAALRLAEPEAWRMSDSTFFIAFIAICALIAAIALLLH